MKIIAKTFEGLEDTLAKEVERLGGEDVEVVKRAVIFSGRKDLLYKCNYQLRCTSRLLVHVKKGYAADKNSLYDLISTIRWDDYFDLSKTFSISVVLNSKNFTHSQFVAQRAKDAIVDQFRDKYGDRPNVDIKNPNVKINIQISGDNANISLDSSGKSLHKRGYKEYLGQAPVSEILAAGIVYLSEFQAYKKLVDPMCGSGTFLCEAIMQECNIPSRFFDPNFAFQHWKNYDQEVWADVKERADQEIESSSYPFLGFDLESDALSDTKANIAAFSDYATNIKIRKKDFFELESQEDAVFILNPPYGERIEVEDLFGFYGTIGDTMKQKQPGNTFWLLSANMDAIKKIGLRSDKRVNLYNGPLAAKLLKYEIFKGKRKDFKSR